MQDNKEGRLRPLALPKRMNIDYCKEFIELSDCMNFTQAAKNLNLHQSTLSKHVQTMEKELGTKLIGRNGTGLQLTETGYAFVGYANKIIETYDQAVSEIGYLKTASPLRVDWQLFDQGLISIISAALIINDKASGTPVVHHTPATRDLVSAVAKGELDMAIVTTLPEMIVDAELESIRLFANPMVVIADSTNELAKNDCVYVSDLRNETFIRLLHEHAKPGWEIIKHLCEQNGFTPKTRDVLVSSHPEQLAIPLHGCIYLYSSKEREMKILSKLHGYACIPLCDDEASLDVYAVYRPENTERVAGFMKALQEAKGLFSEN